MGYKHDQRLPSEVHDETIVAQQEEAEEPLPPYPGQYTPSVLTTTTSYPDTTSRVSLDSSTGRASPIESLTLAGNDPRAASTESLLPTTSQLSSGKRTLLLIYIHGFLGNETSFATFPSHIHTLLTTRLSNTHAVHTKIYPRYKTRNNIRTVRDQFSSWLTPHESPSNVDIILLGHSMGGIVAAEVALIPSMTYPGEMKHKLLGTMNLDVPFLGMHPGIIGAGLSSVFGNMTAPPKEVQSNVAEENATTAGEDMAILPIPPGGEEESSTIPSLGSSSSHIGSSSSGRVGSSSSLSLPEDQDPYFNPKFTNDLPVPVRKPVANVMHFVDKHLMKAERKTDLLKAGGKLISSHFEFGGTMAQYTKLDDRYKRLRALEKDPYNLRFVNYFSTCSGRPKPAKPPKLPPRSNEATKAGQGSFEDLDTEDEVLDIKSLTMTHTDPIPEPQTPPREDSRDPIEAAADDDNIAEDEDAEDNAEEDGDNGSSDDEFEDAAEMPDSPTESATAQQLQQKISLLPPLPAEPVAPADFDPSLLSDKDAQKLAKQQHTRQMKVYDQAVKDRNTAIKEREKLIAKYEKEILKTQSKEVQDAAKAAKKAAQAMQAAEKKAAQQRAAGEKKAAQEQQSAEKKAAKEKEAAEKKATQQKEAAEKKAAQQQEADEKKAWKQRIKDEKLAERERAKAEKQKQKAEAAEASTKEGGKLKTFCLTPPKATTGQRPDWLPVFVEKADQVDAHCGLFDASRPHYEQFVHQVVDKMAAWVDEMEGTLGLA